MVKIRRCFPQIPGQFCTLINNVGYVLGLARNKRLQRALGKEMEEARLACERTGEAARCFRDFRYRTRKSWSCERRVIGKA
ncbi:transposase, partial [Thiolapillus sp.]